MLKTVDNQMNNGMFRYKPIFFFDYHIVGQIRHLLQYINICYKLEKDGSCLTAFLTNGLLNLNNFCHNCFVWNNAFSEICIICNGINNVQNIEFQLIN